MKDHPYCGEDGTKLRLMYLHALFDDCKQDGVGWTRITKSAKGELTVERVHQSIASNRGRCAGQSYHKSVSERRRAQGATRAEIRK